MGETIVTLADWQVALTAVVFVLVAGLEALFPERGHRAGRLTRWAANAVLYGASVGLLFLISPALGTAARWLGEISPMPPLVGLGLPAWALVVVGVLIIDLLAYLSHLAFHSLPWLWRLHRTHHSDVVVDASTGIRHHPIETVLNAVVMLAVFALLGLPLLVILGYALAALVWQFVTHMDVRLPEAIDRPLRAVVVTPGMHHVHHSTLPYEGNSNFGQILSIWDHLFGTYRHRPAHERAGLAVGVYDFPAGKGVTGPMLEPFRR